MRIYVCVKHVPDTAANIKVDGGTGYDPVAFPPLCDFRRTSDIHVFCR